MYYHLCFKYTTIIMKKCMRFINLNCGIYITKQLKFINLERYSQTQSISCFSNILKDCSNISSVSKYITKLNTIDISNIAKNLTNEKLDNISQETRETLLQNCGKYLSNRTLDFRINLCNTIFQKIISLNSLTINDYNVYIKVCTENEVNIGSSIFLESLKCKPNEETFKLLLENVCDRGDITQAYDILSRMKENNFAVDIRVFNALILVHTIKEGEKGANSVLETMKAAEISKNLDTDWNIIIGLATRLNKNEFLKVLNDSTLILNDDYFIKLLMKLCLYNNYELVENVKTKLNIGVFPRHLLYTFEQLCIHLIHRNKSRISFHLYSTLVEYGNQNDCGNFLLEEMLNSEVDSSDIINICKYLKNTERNLYALEYVTEISLKNDPDRAWVFLEHFDKLRVHYFWPLLLNSAKKHGEIGLIKAVHKMLDLKVDIDSETLNLFILPFCDISSPKIFLARIQHLNLSIRQLLTPLLIILLKDARITAASQLCENYNTSIIDAKSLIHPLALAWKNSKNANCTLKILERIYKTNKSIKSDVFGYVLVDMLKKCDNMKDYDDFLKFLQVLHTEKFTITELAREKLGNILQKKEPGDFKVDIEHLLDKLLDILKQPAESLITHPNNMTVDELECHLIELTNKNMETRGVLRRLIQTHARIGNHERVQELRDLFVKSGYEESPGMKAALLQTYIKTKQYIPALKIYRELRRNHLDFTIDEFKLLDLATLFVQKDNFEVAMELLKEGCRNRKVKGGSAIERNCFNLLNSTKTPDDATKLFQFLTDRGFCEPKNLFLGPVVRSYIKSNELENAVTSYENCCKKYKCTPLQVELLQIIVEAKNEELLKRTLDATAIVHGSKQTQVSLAVALATKGMKKALLKLLLEVGRISDSELKNRCNRLVKEGNCEPLLVLAEVSSKLKPNVVNLDIVHMAIIRILDNKNDSEGALEFMNKLKLDEVVVSQQVIDIFNNLIRRSQPSTNNKMNINNVS